jgi:hypothetical protein
MSSEYNSGQGVEKYRPTHTEHTILKIEKGFEDTALSSPKFLAFSDYADFVDVDFALRKFNNDDTTMNIELSLIKETIRQRTNSVVGYKREYENAEKLKNELADAIEMDKKGRAMSHYSIYLSSLKNKIINQQNKQ